MYKRQPSRFQTQTRSHGNARITASVQQQQYNVQQPALQALAFVYVYVRCSPDDAFATTCFKSNFKIKHTSSNLILSPNTGIYIGTPDYDVSPFQLATPLGWQVNHIPKNFVLYVLRSICILSSTTTICVAVLIPRRCLNTSVYGVRGGGGRR